jgi:hypothetical protein
MKSTERRTYTTRIASLEAEKLTLETELNQLSRRHDTLQTQYEQRGRALLEAKLWIEKARSFLRLMIAQNSPESNQATLQRNQMTALQLSETVSVLVKRELMVDKHEE